MDYKELKKIFTAHEDKHPGNPLEGYISFSSFGPKETRSFPPRGRTYIVSSSEKAFRPNMGGYSIYGSSLDGSDPCVRLESYMAQEHGGKDGWVVDDCCIVTYLLQTIHLDRKANRSQTATEIFYNRKSAAHKMVQMLAGVAGVNAVEAWGAYKDGNFSGLSGDAYQIQDTSAYCHQADSDSWMYTVQTMRIYDADHILFGDVED